MGNILNRFEQKGIIAKDAIKQKGRPIDSGLPFVVWTTKLVNACRNPRNLFGGSFVKEKRIVMSRIGENSGHQGCSHVKTSGIFNP